VGDDQQDQGCDQERRIDELLDDHVEVDEVTENQRDKVLKEDPVVAVLGPKHGETEVAGE
jgi:hypothetical protein